MWTHQSEREQIPGVDGNEGLLGESRVAVEDVAEDTGTSESQGHVCETVGQDWTGPVGDVVDCSAEAEEACCTEDGDDDHERQTELWLVDTVVLPSEVETDVVVQWTGDEFTEGGEDERR